jgi:hypothetical protein
VVTLLPTGYVESARVTKGDGKTYFGSILREKGVVVNDFVVPTGDA